MDWALDHTWFNGNRAGRVSFPLSAEDQRIFAEFDASVESLVVRCLNELDEGKET